MRFLLFLFFIIGQYCISNSFCQIRPTDDVPVFKNFQEIESHRVDPVIDDDEEVERLIRENFLSGSCIEIRNINSKSVSEGGRQVQIGRFQGDVNLNVGFDEGIILSSGRVSNATGPNNSTQTSGTLQGSGDNSIPNSFDAAFLEFEFKPTGDEISFRYVFGSDEYPEFVCTNVNDQFSFLIKKAGTNDPLENIALVPDTNDAVTIDNVNNEFTGDGCPVNDYSEYYVENSPGSQRLEYDGFTTVLTARKDNLDECEWYYIKIVIADVGDSAVDSSVFLEANSFADNNPISFSAEGSISGTLDAEESCKNGKFIIERGEDQPDDEEILIELGVSGTATPGVDYEELPTSVVIPAFESFVEIPVIPFFDSEEEGDETIVLEATNITCGCTAVPLSAELNIIDYSLNTDDPIEDIICQGNSYELPDGRVVDEGGTYQSIIPRLSNPDCDSIITHVLTEVDSPETTNLQESPFDCSGSGGTVNLLNYQDDFILEDDTAGLRVTFFEDENLETEITNPENFNFTENTTVFVVVGYENDDTCESVVEIELFITEAPPEINTSLTDCVTQSSEASFDLSTLVSEIQDGNQTVSVSFHEQLEDASADTPGGLNPISDITSYTSVTNTIYSRAELTYETGICFTTAEVELTVVTQPQSITETLSFCDDTNETRLELSDFNLTVPNGVSVEFYRNQEDAEQGINEIQFPTTFTSETIIAKSISELNDTCVNYGEIDITVNQNPEVSISPIQACRIETVATFDLEAVKQDIENSLDNVTVNFYETENSTTALPLSYESENQTIYARVTNSITDCFTNAPLALLVIEEVIEPQESIVYCNGSPYTLKDGRIVTEAGLYEGTFFDPATGCDRSFSTLLLPATLQFPTAFAPNSNGVNDSFKPIFLDNCNTAISDYQLVIYNRWGEKVFESNEQENGWDGLFNSENSPTGIYVWYATYKNGEDSVSRSGTIHLLR